MTRLVFRLKLTFKSSPGNPWAKLTSRLFDLVGRGLLGPVAEAGDLLLVFVLDVLFSDGFTSGVELLPGTVIGGRPGRRLATGSNCATGD